MTKLLALLAWIELHIAPLFIAAVIGFGILLGLRSCKDSNRSNEAAVMSERIRVDTVRDKSDSIAVVARDLELARQNEMIGRLLGKLQTPRLPIPVGTPHDSVVHLAQAVKACRDDSDSLVKSVVQFRSACQGFRDTATKTIADLRLSRSHLDSLLKIGKPPKRWSFGPFVGWGIHQDSAWAIKRGFSVGIGITYGLLQW